MYTECPYCKTGMVGPDESEGKVIHCGHCKRVFTARPCPIPPEPLHIETVQQSTGRVLLFFGALLLCSAMFALGAAFMREESPQVAMYFLWASVAFATSVVVVWFIWTLACLRSIASSVYEMASRLPPKQPDVK